MAKLWQERLPRVNSAAAWDAILWVFLAIQPVFQRFGEPELESKVP